jgi:hypothetical protein
MAGVNSWPLISTAAAYKVDTPRVQQKMWDMLSPEGEGWRTNTGDRSPLPWGEGGERSEPGEGFLR